MKKKSSMKKISRMKKTDSGWNRNSRLGDSKEKNSSAGLLSY